MSSTNQNDATTAQTAFGKKMEQANVDPLIQEAESKNTQSTLTNEEAHPGITATEDKEDKKIEKLERDAQPTG